MSEETRKSWRSRPDGGAIVGILLLGLGALFLLQNLDIIYIHSVWSFWPFILVAIGIQKLYAAKATDAVGGGLWMIFIGLWLYTSIERLWGYGFSETWPALLIVWGIGMIWRSFGRPWPFLRKEMES